MTKVKVEQHGSAGMLWFAAWLFTLGYMQLPFFWRGVLAILLWPYYLGTALAASSPIG